MYGRISAFFISILALAACTSPTDKSREIHDELVYFKDHRTDLCFAYLYENRDTSNSNSARTGGPALASVDCAKVAHLLVNPPAAPRPTTPEAP